MSRSPSAAPSACLVAVALLLALCSQRAAAWVSIAGVPVYHSATFMYASAPFDLVNGTVIPILVGAGCTPISPTNGSIFPSIALYVFNQAIVDGGCASFADVIDTPAFAAIDASLSLFSLPIMSRAEEGFFDPIGNKYRYLSKGYKLVVINMTSGDALAAAAAASNNTLVISVDSDRGNWIDNASSPNMYAMRACFGIVFYGFFVYAAVMNVRSIYRDGRDYRITKYNNAIYWCLCLGALLLGFEMTIDVGGFNNLWSVGQWQMCRYFGLIVTQWIIPLLISAWARVVSKVPLNQMRSWMSTVAQTIIYFSMVVLSVSTIVGGVQYTLLEAASTAAVFFSVCVLIGAAANLLMCATAILFGGWLLFLLQKFSFASGSNSGGMGIKARATNIKTTSLMLTVVFVLLFFIVIMLIMGGLYLTPGIYLIVQILECVFMSVIMLVVVITLRVSGFHFSSYSSKTGSTSVSNQPTPLSGGKSAVSPSAADRKSARNENTSYVSSSFHNTDELVMSLQANNKEVPPSVILLQEVTDKNASPKQTPADDIV